MTHKATAYGAHLISDRVGHLDDIRQRAPEYARCGHDNALHRHAYGNRMLKYGRINKWEAPYPHSTQSDSTSIADALIHTLSVIHHTNPDVSLDTGDTLQTAHNASKAETEINLDLQNERIGLATLLVTRDESVASRAMDIRSMYPIADKRSLVRKHIRPSASKVRKVRAMARYERSTGGRVTSPNPHGDIDPWADVLAICAQASRATVKTRKWYRSRLRSMCRHNPALDWDEVKIHFQSTRCSDNTSNVLSSDIR